MTRYFIGHALTHERKAAVDGLREMIAGKFGVNAALKIVPHMTLFYPFEAEDVSGLAERLEGIAKDTEAFLVPVTGVGAFGERVWFLDPAQEPALFLLKKRIVTACKEVLGIEERSHGDVPHFHVTLAYKDLTPETHRAIGEFLSGQRLPVGDLSIDSMTLFRYEGERWVEERVFRFGG